VKKYAKAVGCYGTGLALQLALTGDAEKTVLAAAEVGGPDAALSLLKRIKSPLG
jgi:hypothetical protein